MDPTDRRNSGVPDVVSGRDADATPDTLVEQPQPRGNGDTFDQKVEVQFLADEFGVAPINAAQMLVEDEAAAQELAAEVMAEERERDPLEVFARARSGQGPRACQKACGGS